MAGPVPPQRYRLSRGGPGAEALTNNLTPGNYRLALGTALAVITWLALTPTIDMPGQSDKLAHILAFLVLAWLAGRAFPRPVPLPLPMGLLLLYGAALELLQHTLPHRMGSWPDLLADAVGLALYALVSTFFTDRRRTFVFRAPKR